MPIWPGTRKEVCQRPSVRQPCDRLGFYLALPDRDSGSRFNVDMAQDGRATRTRSAYISRRTFLTLTGLSIFSLSACGDDSSNRQFAGGPQTAGPNGTGDSESATGIVSGSPTAVPTAMPVAEMLSTPGSVPTVTVRRRHDLTAIDVADGSGQVIWSDLGRAIWASAIDATGEMAAVLTSPAKSASEWTVDFVDTGSGASTTVVLGDRTGTPAHLPDSVAGGRGGIAWMPDSSSVAVALPTGGLWQVFPDGSQVKLLPAAAAKRPAALAVSQNGDTLAFVDQPSGSEGSGVYAGSMKAKPIDPIVVLPADRSGNRYARGVAWIPSGNRVATIIEREELGNPQGDLFYIDTHSGVPELGWTSPPGRDVASVESFAVSLDGQVIGFVTNPTRPGHGKPSSLWLMQVDGPTIERFDLPVALGESTVSFTDRGVVASGTTGQSDERDGIALAYLLETSGQVVELYREQTPATPAASPMVSPGTSPVASPSPVASMSAG